MQVRTGIASLDRGFRRPLDGPEHALLEARRPFRGRRRRCTAIVEPKSIPKIGRLMFLMAAPSTLPGVPSTCARMSASGGELPTPQGALICRLEVLSLICGDNGCQRAGGCSPGAGVLRLNDASPDAERGSLPSTQEGRDVVY